MRGEKTVRVCTCRISEFAKSRELFSSVQLLRSPKHGLSRTAQVRPSMVPSQVSGARPLDERRRGVCRLPRPTPVRQPPALRHPPRTPLLPATLRVALLTAACAAGGPSLAARSSRAAYVVPERRAAPALAPSTCARRSGRVASMELTYEDPRLPAWGVGFPAASVAVAWCSSCP